MFSIGLTGGIGSGKTFIAEILKANFDIKIFDSILTEWNLKEKLAIVKEKMNRYGFKSKLSEMEQRFMNYRQIILDEFNN